MNRFTRTTRATLSAAAAAVILCAGSAAGAEWKDTADAALAKQVPAGFRVEDDKRGDLNGDGSEDCVLLIKGTDAKKITAIRDDAETYGYADGNDYGLMVFFKEGGGWRLAAENRAFLGPALRDCETCAEGEFGCEIKKGNIYISVSNHGRWTDKDEKYTFRYRNSEMELIGYDLVMARENGEHNPQNISVNFPAKKLLSRVCALESTDCDFACECLKYKETWSSITPKGTALLRTMKKLDAAGLWK